MGRLGIFVFYDREGMVDRYVENLLAELHKNVDKLLIVVNGEINKTAALRLKKISEILYIRQNKGFDAGAYADIIVNKVGKQELSNWEELVFCNDTFFGPFVPMKDIFKKMEQVECDFWGIDGIKRDFLSYIIPYFYVFRGEILKNGDLYEYLYENIYEKINDTADAYALWEVGLYHTLCKRGYKSSTYVYTEGCLSKKMPDTCVKKYNLPIWKKRFFLKENYNVQRCNLLLAYLKEQGVYDISTIQENVKRLYNLEIPENNELNNNNEVLCDAKYSIPQINGADLENFLLKNDRVCIYGAGAFARATYFVFKDQIKDFQGFVVSDDAEVNECSVWGHPILRCSQVCQEDAIVVAMNLKNSMQVHDILKGRKKVFYFWRW